MFVEDVLLSITKVGEINRCFSDPGRRFGVVLLHLLHLLRLPVYVARKERKLGKTTFDVEGSLSQVFSSLLHILLFSQ